MAVVDALAPCVRGQLLWVEAVVVIVGRVHIYRATPVELCLVVVGSEQLVVDHQLRRHVVGAALVFGKTVSHC